MTTPPPSSTVGSSRLLGTDDAQRAVDSLTRQVQALERAVANAARAFQSAANTTNRATGRTSGGGSWNTNSNFPTNNGGQRGQFTQTGNMNGQTQNGGGWRGAAMVMMGAGRGNGNAGGGGGGGAVTAGMGRLGIAGAVVFGAARGLVNYGNRTMSSNMQMDMFGSYGALSGGIGPGGFQATNNTAMRQVFNYNRIALDANDAARGGYAAAYTFGSPQFNGQANRSFVQGTRMASAFAFASPTAGYTGAMQAAQQTYAPRAAVMSQALGLANPILPGGQYNSMGNIASSIMGRTFQGRTQVSTKELDAALRQGGSLSTNLSFYGQQMGWSAKTTQMYENYIKGMNLAQNKGMSREEYDRLTTQAATGTGDAKKNALAKLKETTGLGANMFERQRDLNATRLTRQERILEHLAPAFEKATDMVNKFSQALTDFLESTGLDNVIGTGAGWATPFSNALGGFGGLGGGLLGGGLAALLMRGGGGGLGGLFSRVGGLFGGGGGGAAGGAARGLGGMLNATRGANGVYNITSLGSTAGGAGGMLSRLSPLLGRAGIAGAGYTFFKSVFDAGAYAGDPKNQKEHPILSRLAGTWSGAPHLGGIMQPGSMGMLSSLVGSAGSMWPAAKRLLGSDGLFGGAGGESSQTKSKKKSKKGEAAPGAGGATAAEVISNARQQLGDPYVWGGVGPDGWDCSGLIQWAYAQAGVKIPRVSQNQQKVGKAVATDKVQPGDLLFNGSPAHHVAMAIGGGKLIEAPRTGLNVRIRSYKPGEFTNARRILGSVGNMDSVSTDPTAEGGLNEQGSTVGGNIGGAYGGTSELAAIMAALGGGSAGGAMPLSASSTSTSGGTESTGTSDAGKDAPKNVKANVALGKKMAAEMGWTGNQWEALYKLWMGESGWRHWADNPNSDAYGIPQAMSNIHKETATEAWRTSPSKQIAWGLKYIKGRYGSPAKAWSFWNSKNPHWYDAGAWNLEQDTTARVHKGEMILPAKQAESVRNAIVNTMTTGTNSSGGKGVTFEAGSIVVNPAPGMTQQEARMTAKQIVDAVMEDNRIKAMQIGH